MRRNGFQHIETYRSLFGFASFYIYKLFQSCAPDTSVWYDPYFFLYVPTPSNGFNLRLQARFLNADFERYQSAVRIFCRRWAPVRFADNILLALLAS